LIWRGCRGLRRTSRADPAIHVGRVSVLAQTPSLD
jgi:hypothetical protein